MYAQSYQEFELIGRGNFGSAYLVRSLIDQKVYVAKKIQLHAMKQKEQDDALRESSLLQKLHHPHIVSFKETFTDESTLIIVMEYCEEGDLSFHIKRKNKQSEYFPEKLILHWFLQTALALKYIHEQKILHRDIKSSNIFVTSNGFAKIGDFGISKVLEHTIDSANTLVGTPYYMSPEVCENKPYSHKSDVWALGCVLYELCTLKHAFDASNLLGLVYKIVKDQVPDIPNHYSKDLQKLVKSLLSKDDRQRPNIKDILGLDFIRREMEDFITSNGKEVHNQMPIKRTQTHQEIEKMISQEQKETTMQTLKSGYMNTCTTQAVAQLQQQEALTPTQRIKLKKEQEAQKQRDLLANAARQNVNNSQLSHQKRLNDLAGSNPNQHNQPNQITKPKDLQNTLDAYEMTVKSEMEQSGRQMTNSLTFKSEMEKTRESKMSNNSLTIKSEMEQTKQMGVSSNFDQTVDSTMEQTLQSESVFVTRDNQNHYMDQPIKVTNSQLDRYSNAKQKEWENYGTIQPNKEDLGVTQSYADEEFEEYNSDEEADKPRLTEQAGESEVLDVVSLYKIQLSQMLNSPSNKQSGQLSEIKETSQESWTSSQKSRDEIPIRVCKLNNLRKSAIAKLGAEQFNKIYSYMSHHRQKGTSDEILHKSLIEMAGKEKYADCRVVDEIIFLEMTAK